MTPRDLGNMHTTRNSSRDTLCDMALKLSQYFYLQIEKPLACFFQVQSSYYQAAHCNQKTLILVSSRWQVRYEKTKNRISLCNDHSYHQHLSLYASLNWSSNAIRFSFNQPNRKRLSVRLVDRYNKTSTP